MSKKVLMVVGTLFLILLLWEGMIFLLKVPAYVLPAPSHIVQTLVQEFAILWRHSLVTLQESLIGLGLSALLAILIALLMDLHETLRQALQSVLVLSQTIPTIVLAPLLMVWLGFGIAPKIVVIVLMCFYPIAVNLFAGFQEVSSESLDLLQSFGATTLQIYRKAKIPAAAPGFFAGLRVAATYSVTGAVVAEWLSSKAGLGYYMIRVSNAYHLDKVFACLFMIMAWSLLMNLAVNGLQRLVTPGCGLLAQWRLRRATRQLARDRLLQ